MAKKKIGVLFGAGAEIALGMPNGGEFAGNILFPSDDIRNKAEAEYEARTSDSQFRTFTSADLKSVMSSTLEKKRVEIGRFFRHFDEIYETGNLDALTDDAANDDDAPEMPKRMEEMLDALDTHGLQSADDDYREMLRFVFSLYLGMRGQHAVSASEKAVLAHGKAVGKKIKDLFSDDQYDRLENLFTFNAQRLYSLSKNLISVLYSLKDDADYDGAYNKAVRVSKKLFEATINYEQLLQKYYDALFDEAAGAAKWKKIASFMYIIRQFIVERFAACDATKKSFYSDLRGSGDVDFVIGTTNYSNIEKLSGFKKYNGGALFNRVYYLNGCVDEYLDVAAYDILESAEAEPPKRCVPFLFPQTTVKPFVSIQTVKRFGDVYTAYSQCDVVGVVGFGFNSDDGIINSIFHRLIQNGTKVVYFAYRGDSAAFNSAAEKNALAKKLHCENAASLSVARLDKNRKTSSKNWLVYIKEHLARVER